MISRLLEGEFLDYNAANPEASSTEIFVWTRSFIESVERVSLLITDRLKSPVRCIFSGNEIRVSCSTSIGRANDQIEAKITGNDVEMGFNNRYLLDALRNTEGDAFLFLVLPVRLKNE